MGKRVRHDNRLAEEIARAANLGSATHLKKSAVRLARKLELELPLRKGSVDL